MAKALLLNALHKTLADYVVGLSPEKLKVGVWSGKIILQDLQVSPRACRWIRAPSAQHAQHGMWRAPLYSSSRNCDANSVLSFGQAYCVAQKL